jgi:hypothetical protein
VDFSRVLVTDRLAWEVFGAAAQERLLFTRQSDEQQPHTRPGTARQRALTLLVLFDSLVVHEYGEGTFRLPDLEKDGIVEIISSRQAPYNGPALRTKWGRGVFNKAQLQDLSLIQRFRPLVINRALKSKGDDFSSVMAKHLGGSRRKYLNLFFDYVLAIYQGDMKALQ